MKIILTFLVNHAFFFINLWLIVLSLIFLKLHVLSILRKIVLALLVEVGNILAVTRFCHIQKMLSHKVL